MQDRNRTEKAFWWNALIPIFAIVAIGCGVVNSENDEARLATCTRSLVSGEAVQYNQFQEFLNEAGTVLSIQKSNQKLSQASFDELEQLRTKLQTKLSQASWRELSTAYKGDPLKFLAPEGFNGADLMAAIHLSRATGLEETYELEVTDFEDTTFEVSGQNFTLDGVITVPGTLIEEDNSHIFQRFINYRGDFSRICETNKGAAILRKLGYPGDIFEREEDILSNLQKGDRQSEIVSFVVFEQALIQAGTSSKTFADIVKFCTDVEWIGYAEPPSEAVVYFSTQSSIEDIFQAQREGYDDVWRSRPAFIQAQNNIENTSMVWLDVSLRLDIHFPLIRFDGLAPPFEVAAAVPPSFDLNGDSISTQRTRVSPFRTLEVGDYTKFYDVPKHGEYLNVMVYPLGIVVNLEVMVQEEPDWTIQQ